MNKKSVKTYHFQEIRVRVEKALREAFGENVAIATEESYGGRVHVKIVSPTFDDMDPIQQQDAVHDALNKKLGTEAQAVSLVIVKGMEHY